MRIVVLLLLVTSLAHGQFIKNNGIEIVNTADLNLNGDWVNDAGTAIKNNGVIKTSDSWTNNGTLDPASTGGFVLNYASAKSFAPGGTNFGFLVKEGTGNANISGQFAVKDSLKISGGIITPLTATDILTVAETGTVSSVPGSFLEGGNLVRQGTGNLFFPVGKNGISLPITFLNVSGASPSISVTLEDAPGGYTAGAGVNALINFPYVWKATKTNVADSASYVELEYPNTLPTDANLVVVRKITGQNSYQGMGKRSVTNSGGVIKIKSYSRGLQGTFSVASGFAGNLETDKAALVAFYNSTDGTNWTNDNQWLSTDVTTWNGVTETGGYITSLSLPNNLIKGAVPAEFADIAGLVSVNLSGNALTAIPDFSALTSLTSLNVSNNKLDFGSLEANAAIVGINYSNQADIGVPTDELVDVGLPYSFNLTAGGTVNQYQWKRNGTAISGATSNQYNITAIDRANSGTYIAEVTNTMVPGLTLKSASRKATAVANITGKLKVNATDPVTAGKMILLKIKPVGVAFDTTRVLPVLNDGTYNLSKIPLDDYILLGQGDKTTYADYFPTYFEGSIFWEAADTIKLNENRNSIDIVLASLPVPPKGDGSLTGLFEEEFPGGRTEKRGRIGGASGSVRRAQSSGRPTKVMAEEVVKFTYTDANGNFVFDNLEAGNYLLNLQYPGVPMDTKSDIAFTIGSKATRQNEQKVTALAAAGKITVEKLVIVGVSEETQERIEIYPNPVSKDLYVTLGEGDGAGEMKLFDARGAEVLSRNLSEGKTTSDLSQFSAGIYILKIYRKGKEVSVARVVIE